MITIINGGTQGLGAAVARRLVATGITEGLLLVGRSADRGNQLAEELTAAGVDTAFLQADLADAEAPAAIVGRRWIALVASTGSSTCRQ